MTIIKQNAPTLALEKVRFCSYTTVVLRLKLSQSLRLPLKTTTDESGCGAQELPRCLEELAGKDYVFQICVTPYNSTPNYRTFNVSAIRDGYFFLSLNQRWVNKFSNTFSLKTNLTNTCTTVYKSSSRNQALVVDWEGELATTSGSYTVYAAKIAKGVEEANPPSFEDK